jgi:hypothetical protein
MANIAGKLTAWPLIRKGIGGLGYAYWLEIRRYIYKPNGERDAVDLAGYTAQFVVRPSRESSPAQTLLTIESGDNRLAWILVNGRAAGIVLRLTANEVAALGWQKAWAELYLIDSSNNRWRWLAAPIGVVN